MFKVICPDFTEMKPIANWLAKKQMHAKNICYACPIIVYFGLANYYY